MAEDKTASFGDFLKDLDEDSYEDKVMNYLNSCRDAGGGDRGGVEVEEDEKHAPCRRHSDVSVEIFSRVNAILSVVPKLSQARHHNSVINETFPTSSCVYKYVAFRGEGCDRSEPEARETTRTPREPQKRRLFTVIETGPDLSRVLKPETLAILKESKQDVNFTTRSLLDSMRKTSSDKGTLLGTEVGLIFVLTCLRTFSLLFQGAENGAYVTVQLTVRCTNSGYILLFGMNPSVA